MFLARDVDQIDVRLLDGAVQMHFGQDALKWLSVYRLYPSVQQHVPDSENPTQAPDSATDLALDANRDAYIQALAGYAVENQSAEVLLIGETIVAGGSVGTDLEPGSFSVDDRGIVLETPTERIRYDCPLGGTVVADIGELRLSESSYSNVSDHNRYDFDQCRIDTDSEQLLTGSVRVLTISISASRGGFNHSDVEWTDFSWQQGENGLVAGTALIDIRRLLSFDNSESRAVSVDQFEQRQQGETTMRVDRGSMTLTAGTEANGAIEYFSLSVGGNITTSEGVAVQVSILQPMNAKLAVPDFTGTAEAFSGMLEYRGADGSELLITAKRTVAIGSVLIDTRYTSAEGDQKLLVDQVFSVPSIGAP